MTFQHGKVNALIGPNGSGKTTFFNCVTGMIKPDSGRVTYRGPDITRKAPHTIARAGIGRSFQLCRVFPRMTVLDNVLAAVRPASLTAQLASARNREEMRPGPRLAEAAWASTTSSAREARNLSWGQQKLLELAGVLMADPETILLDEPAGGVNPALIGRIGTLVRAAQRRGQDVPDRRAQHGPGHEPQRPRHRLRPRPPDRRRPAVDDPDPTPSPGGIPWRLIRYLRARTTSRPAYGRAALVLRGLTVTVPAGTVVCLVGPNGAGKSTVLKVASGLLDAALGPDPGRRQGRHRSADRSRCSPPGSRTSCRGTACSAR